MGAALRTAANEMALAEARAAHKAEVERITAENARVATLHQEEVQEKIVKEQQYAKVDPLIGYTVKRLGKSRRIRAYA